MVGWLKIQGCDWLTQTMLASYWLIPVHPDTASDEPAAQEECYQGLNRMCGLRILVTSGLCSPHATQHSDKIFKSGERS